MFTMMNKARLTVGLQGVSVAERAYQQALSYCNERVQGVAPGYKEAGPIIRHPDVQRMLATMKSITEAARALTYNACTEVDMAASDLPDKALEKHTRRLGLFTPIVKGWCTEVAQEVATLSLQCHGGMGFIEETGIAQIFRDARILPIYEGTNGIQSMDLVVRKIIGDNGLAINELIVDMRESLSSLSPGSPLLGSQIDCFKASVDDLEKTVSLLLKHSTNRQFSGSVAFDVLMMTSTITAAWQMFISVERAKLALESNKVSSEFFDDKTTTAQYFIDSILPRYVGHFMAINSADIGDQ
jgi:hypothetical protein